MRRPQIDLDPENLLILVRTNLPSPYWERSMLPFGHQTWRLEMDGWFKRKILYKWRMPSGNFTVCNGTSPIFERYIKLNGPCSTMFNSYVKLPEGHSHSYPYFGWSNPPEPPLKSISSHYINPLIDIIYIYISVCMSIDRLFINHFGWFNPWLNPHESP